MEDEIIVERYELPRDKAGTAGGEGENDGSDDGPLEGV